MKQKPNIDKNSVVDNQTAEEIFDKVKAFCESYLGKHGRTPPTNFFARWFKHTKQKEVAYCNDLLDALGAYRGRESFNLWLLVVLTSAAFNHSPPKSPYTSFYETGSSSKNFFENAAFEVLGLGPNYFTREIANKPLDSLPGESGYFHGITPELIASITPLELQKKIIDNLLGGAPVIELHHGWRAEISPKPDGVAGPSSIGA